MSQRSESGTEHGPPVALPIGKGRTVPCSIGTAIDPKSGLIATGFLFHGTAVRGVMVRTTVRPVPCSVPCSGLHSAASASSSVIRRLTTARCALARLIDSTAMLPAPASRFSSRARFFRACSSCCCCSALSMAGGYGCTSSAATADVTGSALVFDVSNARSSTDSGNPKKPTRENQRSKPHRIQDPLRSSTSPRKTRSIRTRTQSANDPHRWHQPGITACHV